MPGYKSGTGSILFCPFVAILLAFSVQWTAAAEKVIELLAEYVEKERKMMPVVPANSGWQHRTGQE